MEKKVTAIEAVAHIEKTVAQIAADMEYILKALRQ